jgi:hypothetical protein
MLEALEARLTQNASTSSRPPMRQRQSANDGGPPPSDGSRVANVVILAIRRYAWNLQQSSRFFPKDSCGHRGLVELTLYHTHQVIELPVVRPKVTHWLLPQGQCLSCGKLCKATVPADHVSGSGPRLTGFVGEMAGIVGASRSAVQDLYISVFGIPLSKGAI